MWIAATGVAWPAPGGTAVGALNSAAAAVAFQFSTTFDGAAAAACTGRSVAAMIRLTTARTGIRSLALRCLIVPSHARYGTRAASGRFEWIPKQRRTSV